MPRSAAWDAQSIPAQYLTVSMLNLYSRAAKRINTTEIVQEESISSDEDIDDICLRTKNNAKKNRSSAINRVKKLCPAKLIQPSPAKIEPEAKPAENSPTCIDSDPEIEILKFSSKAKSSNEEDMSFKKIREMIELVSLFAILPVCRII